MAVSKCYGESGMQFLENAHRHGADVRAGACELPLVSWLFRTLAKKGGQR